MKNLKTAAFVMTILFLGIQNTNAQQKSSQTVIIKVYEFPANSHSKMMVVDPTGFVVETDLEKMLSKGEQNIVQIHKEINKWKDQGFAVDGITSGEGAVGLITTIILSKDE